MDKRVFIYIFLAFFLLSCNNSPRKGELQTAKIVYQKQNVLPDNAGDDYSTISFRGSIVSEHDIPVYSRVSSMVEDLYVREGMRVNKGQELVKFDGKEMDINVKLAQNQLDQAFFQYKTILVGQGYDFENEDAIPEHVRKAARVRSSVELCESQLENSRLYRSYCTVTALIGGVVTDLNIHQYDYVKEGTPLFHIVDVDNLSVEFYVLETDLKFFRQGTRIIVHPIADEDISIDAEVYYISQKVNASGMIKIKARLQRFDNPVVGMSVLISLN